MKHLKTWLVWSAAIVAFGLGGITASAQPGPGGPGGPGMFNMDPQQMEQMRQEMQKNIMKSFRDQMVVTNDAEWGIIETRLAKVMKLKMDIMMSSGGMMGMGGMRRGGFRFPGMEPSPESEALQKAVENNAPAEQIKDALAKFRDSSKRKKAELIKAQEDLRQVLTVRQEAVLVAATMLD